VHDFLGEVQNDLRGGAHLPSKSGHGYNYLKNTSRTSTVFFRQLYPYQFVASKYTFHLGFLGGGGAHVLEPNNSKSGLSSPMIACTVGGFMGGWATSLRGWA
jgi:hypothetical protein